MSDAKPMSRLQASREARRRWGRDSFVARYYPHDERMGNHWVCEVGYYRNGTNAQGGKTWEEAFKAADDTLPARWRGPDDADRREGGKP